MTTSRFEKNRLNYLNQCHGKARFSHIDKARVAARKSEEIERVPFNVYYCKHCHAYHVGRLSQ